MFSTKGDALFTMFPHALTYLEPSLALKAEKKQIGNILTGRQFIAAKNLFPYNTPSDVSGLELWRVVRDLEKAGFQCAEPLVATENRYVSRWVDGQIVSDNNPDLIRYLALLINARKQMDWPLSWMIDNKPSKHLLAHPEKKEVWEKFVTVDPVLYISDPILSAGMNFMNNEILTKAEL